MAPASHTTKPAMCQAISTHVSVAVTEHDFAAIGCQPRSLQRQSIAHGIFTHVNFAPTIFTMAIACGRDVARSTAQVIGAHCSRGQTAPRHFFWGSAHLRLSSEDVF